MCVMRVCKYTSECVQRWLLHFRGQGMDAIGGEGVCERSLSGVHVCTLC